MTEIKGAEAVAPPHSRSKVSDRGARWAPPLRARGGSAVPLFSLLILLGCRVEATAPEGWPDRRCDPSSDDGEREHQLSLEARDGALLALKTREPRGGNCVPTVLMVPPGFEAGMPLLESPLADALVALPAVLVTWDPRGRGESEGQEDTNGFTGQDDLDEVMRWAAWQESVDPNQLVVYSRSFGGALVAGAVGRHAALDPVAWVDAESPGWLQEEIARTPEHNQERMAAELEGDPDAWWAEREPAGLIGPVDVPYHRLQGLPDHALGVYVSHAVAMVEGATEAPERRYNDLLITEPLTEAAATEAAWSDLDPTGDAVLAVLRDALYPPG